MLSHGDTIRHKSELVNNDKPAMQHRIQLAKSVLLINLPDANGAQSAMTVLNTAMHPMEPVFTREVA